MRNIVFDDGMLYLGLIELTASDTYNSYIGRVDTSEDNPLLEVIISEFPEIGDELIIKDNTLYTHTFFGGNLTTVDLSDNAYPVNSMEQYFGEGFIVIRSIAVSDTHIYYATDGTIGRINLDTNEKEILVQTNYWRLVLRFTP
ncbi:MAG: hypothetical protein AAGF85_05970 [Bacteroidota bacterium]